MLRKKAIAAGEAENEDQRPLQHRVYTLRSAVLETARRYGASNVRLFGSVADNAETRESDVDLLVNFEPSRSLLDQIALAQDLEDLLGAPVDVLTVEALHPLLRAGVLASAKPL